MKKFATVDAVRGRSVGAQAIACENYTGFCPLKRKHAPSEGACVGPWAEILWGAVA